MTLTVVKHTPTSGMIDVSGINMEFVVNKVGSILGITVLDRAVDVWMTTGTVGSTFVNIANIRWASFSGSSSTGTFGDLGWRTSPTDTLQNESITYLPTASTATFAAMPET